MDQVDERASALSHVLSGRGLDQAAARLEKLRLAVEEHAVRAGASSRYSRAEERFRLDGGYAAEGEAHRLARGLGLAEGRLDLPLGALSGGERRRVELARILFAGSDVLLLDEPTNHLDTDAKTWLLDFLRRYRGALLVISHDLDLLDEPITRVLHLERHGHDDIGGLTEYKGTYSQYLAARDRDESSAGQAGRPRAGRDPPPVRRWPTPCATRRPSGPGQAKSLDTRVAKLAEHAHRGPGQAPQPPGPLPRTAHRRAHRARGGRPGPVLRAGRRVRLGQLRRRAGRAPAGDGAQRGGQDVAAADPGRRERARHGDGALRPPGRRRLLRPGARPASIPAGLAHRADARPRHRGRHRAARPAGHVRSERRHRVPPGRHPVRRREDQAGPGPAGGRSPQPAAARRADQQPRPRLPVGHRRSPGRLAGLDGAGQPRP